MGILVLDGPVDLEIDKVGARSTAAGAGSAPVCSFSVPPPLGVGIVGGAVGGALHHKGLELTDDDKTGIITDLQGGKAAVGVQVDFADAGVIEERLTSLGGASSAHDVVDEAALAGASEG